ncbi:MAG: hypothetical protein ACOYK9_05560, partial [Chlamydiia bacterium]
MSPVTPIGPSAELSAAASAAVESQTKLVELISSLIKVPSESDPKLQWVQDGHLYSVLAKNTPPILPNPLVPIKEAIDILDAEINSHGPSDGSAWQLSSLRDDNGVERTPLENWNQYKGKALENVPHLLYDHVDEVRLQQFLEDVNLFLLAFQTCKEKNPEELSTVLMLMTSELNVCRNGILGRFHNSVWPKANNTAINGELPSLALGMIDKRKNEIMQEITGQLFEREVHWRNGLYQAENSRLGLGLSEKELGPREWVTEHFIEARQ